MDPSVWGPPLWDQLFALAFRQRAAESGGSDDTSNVEARAALCDMLRLLLEVLPCSNCRESYRDFYHNDPPAHVDSLPQWLWRCKEAVNRKLHKHYMEYRSVKRRYTAYQTLTSERVCADTLVFMAMAAEMEASEATSKAVRAYARALARAVRGTHDVLPRDFADLLEKHFIDDDTSPVATVQAAHRVVEDLARRTGTVARMDVYFHAVGNPPPKRAASTGLPRHLSA